VAKSDWEPVTIVTLENWERERVTEQ
jgi:hypothetical protein